MGQTESSKPYINFSLSSNKAKWQKHITVKAYPNSGQSNRGHLIPATSFNFNKNYIKGANRVQYTLYKLFLIFKQAWSNKIKLITVKAYPDSRQSNRGPVSRLKHT